MLSTRIPLNITMILQYRIFAAEKTKDIQLSIEHPRFQPPSCLPTLLLAACIVVVTLPSPKLSMVQQCSLLIANHVPPLLISVTRIAVH